MAAPSIREIPPWRMLTAFLLLLVVVFALVFFTGGGKAEPKLGIDLQGGTRVTLTPRTPDGSDPSKDQLNKAKEIIGKRVNGLGVSGSEVLIDGKNLVITVPGNDGSQARALGQTARLFVRPVLDVQAAKPKPPTSTTPDSSAQGQQQAIDQARKARQDLKIQRLTPQIIDEINCDTKQADPLQGNDDPDKSLVACSQDGTQIYLLGPKIIDGRDIKSAEPQTDPQQGGAWSVGVDFKGSAASFWPKYTGTNIGKQTAFTLDSKVVSAPEIQSQIGGKTSISGNFNQSSAKDLANVLKYGSLPLSFKSSDAVTVSATLGLASLRAGLIAGGIGLVAVLIYALLYYRMLGFLTLLSLVASGVMVYGILVLLGRWIGFTLDLSGIAGLIIGIGMTADSFVVYFERIKDEMREGRSFRSAVPRGWTRARRTIWSGNAVSFIAAAAIYFLAIGEVRGFAFTLGLTTILDLVVVILVTHPLVAVASRSNFLSKPGVNGLGAVSRLAVERKRAAAALTKETV